MTQAQDGATVMMNYVYNGRGEQVRRYLGTANTYATYDEAGHWVGDYGSAGAAAPTQQAIWFGDLPVGVFVGAGASQKLYYVEPDALGTPRVVIDPTRGATGTTVWKWDLAGEAFGTTAPNQDPDGDATQFVFNLRFPGQRYDAASGLNYNYFRDYEAATGRYVESDPIGLAGGVAVYDYVLNNPVGLYDRLGLNPAAAGFGVLEGLVVGCISGCLGAVLGDYVICMAKGVWKRRSSLNKGSFRECNGECTPDPCEAAKACATGCIAGGIIGAASAGTGVLLSGPGGFIANKILNKYYTTLFPVDICQSLRLPPPGTRL